MSRTCYVDGCDRYAGWILNDSEDGDLDACAEHAGYKDWQQRQAEFEPGMSSTDAEHDGTAEWEHQDCSICGGARCGVPNRARRSR